MKSSRVYQFQSKVLAMQISKLETFVLPLILSLCILLIAYPGFMSYDSIRMLEEARSSVRGNPFPVAPVYMLRFFDITGHGVTLMLQAQNFVLLLSIVIILRILRANFIASAIALTALLVTPTVIGCMLVLWKDVTLTSLIMASVAMIFWASQTNEAGVYFKIVKWSSLLLLVIGTLMRLNAITAILIIIFYWLSVFYSSQGWKSRGAAFFAIFFLMVASDKLINNYSFPDFKKMPPNTILYAVMANDLIGISGWSRVSLIPIESTDSAPLPKVPLSDIDKIYSPLGALAVNDNNIALGNVVKVFPIKYRNEDITKAWLAAIYNHPLAYLRHRWDLFAEIIGAKLHATYEPTHFNRIDENPFGIKFQDRSITDVTLKYIKWTSNVFFGKPWFVFLLSFTAVFLVFKSNLIQSKVKCLSYFSFAAAVLYIVPFFIISGTGEVRYSFPSIVLGSISIFIWIVAHYLPQRDMRNKIGKQAG